MKKIEFHDGVWVEDPDWICTINDRDIKLGAFFKITNLLDAGCLQDDSPEIDTPWIVESMIYPQPQEFYVKFKEYTKTNDENPRKRLVGYMIDYISGVPFDTQVITPVNKKMERVPGMELPGGIEMPLFKTKQEAKEFCESKLPVIPAVFGLIGLFLDAPLNRLGESGWDLIKYMTLEEE